jgi:hypothetical protein
MTGFLEILRRRHRRNPLLRRGDLRQQCLKALAFHYGVTARFVENCTLRGSLHRRQRTGGGYGGHTKAGGGHNVAAARPPTPPIVRGALYSNEANQAARCISVNFCDLLQFHPPSPPSRCSW